MAVLRPVSTNEWAFASCSITLPAHSMTAYTLWPFGALDAAAFFFFLITVLLLCGPNCESSARRATDPILIRPSCWRSAGIVFTNAERRLIPQSAKLDITYFFSIGSASEFPVAGWFPRPVLRLRHISKIRGTSRMVAPRVEVRPPNQIVELSRPTDKYF